MNKYALKRENTWIPELRTTVLLGFLLRLIVLILIVNVLNGVWDLYFLEDDKKFEEMAAVYRFNANGILDLELFDELTAGYMQRFWPFVICVSTKLFGYLYTGRVINILLSTICIPVTYRLCYEVSGNEKTALTAARLFAYLPFPILVSCFPIKDIYIMMVVMYAFYIFVRVQSGRKVSAFQYVLLCALLVGVYLSRGAVTELMLIFFLVYYLQKLYKEKKYLAALVLLMGSVAVFVAFRSAILSSFETKIDTYGNYYADEASGLNALRVTSMMDIYKLPLAYAYSMLQPMKLELFTIGADTRQWRTVMGYANITMYPVAMGAWLYMFTKKHNLFFWLSSFVMFSAVIMLSLGVFRHYLFLLPIHMVNYSLYTEKTNERYKNRRGMLIIGTFALGVLIFCYSLVKLL